MTMTATLPKSLVGHLAEHTRRQCYICCGKRFGCLCFRLMFVKQQYFLFAWQIYANKKLYRRFDKLDRYYIKNVAELENHDAWYIDAGKKLLEQGEAFLQQ